MIPWPLFPLIAALISMTASLTLFRWVWVLKAPLAGKLMTRQLWHLALADLLASALLVPWFVLDLVDPSEDFGNAHVDMLSAVCRIGHANNLPFMVSVLVEVHIALATVSSLFRFAAALRILSRMLPYVWALGFIIGGVFVWLGDAVWDPQVGSCNPYENAEVVKAFIMTAALAICICTYVACIVAVTRSSSGAVEARIFRRAKLFIMVSVVTWVPFVGVAFFAMMQPGQTTFLSPVTREAYFIQSIFLLSNGSFNTVVYALKSGFVRQTMRRARLPSREAQQDSNGGSFRVAFRSHAEIVSMQTTQARSLTSEEVRAVGREETLLSCFDTVEDEAVETEVSQSHDALQFRHDDSF